MLCGDMGDGVLGDDARAVFDLHLQRFGGHNRASFFHDAAEFSGEKAVRLVTF